MAYHNQHRVNLSISFVKTKLRIKRKQNLHSCLAEELVQIAFCLFLTLNTASMHYKKRLITPFTLGKFNEILCRTEFTTKHPT